MESLTDLEPVIESLVFVSREPLTGEKIVEVLHAADMEVKIQDVRKAMASLLEKWSEPNRVLGQGLVLKMVAGGLIFLTEEKNAVIVKKIVTEKPFRLSKSQLEVLSIVAYRQPISRIDID